MKRIISLLLAVALIFVLSASVVAADEDKYYQYEINPDQTVTITGFLSPNSVTLRIPETLDGRAVTKIGSMAFKSKISLEAVYFPLGLLEIGDYAFYSCTSLKTIYFFDSVKNIGNYAFNTCTALTAIGLKNVETVGDYAFYGCKNITSVTTGGKLVSIGDRAFAKCKLLSSFTFPSTLVSIGDYAFSDCVALKSVRFPASLRTIGNSAFVRCKTLESVTFPDIGDLSIGAYAFENCEALKEITLTPAVTEIGRYAFALRPETAETTFSHDIKITSTGSPAAAIYGARFGVTVYENGSVVKGYADVNGDGRVTTSDARAVLRQVAKIEITITEERMQYADIDQNGKLDLLDVSAILNIALGTV